MPDEIYVAWADRCPADVKHFAPLYDQTALDAEVAAERERWRALLRTPHRMAGGCPDEVAGADSRDLDCPACQLMMELGANAEPMTACPHGVPHRWPCDECGA